MCEIPTLALYIEVTRRRKIPKIHQNSILHPFLIFCYHSSILIFFTHNFFIPFFFFFWLVYEDTNSVICVDFFSIYCIVYVNYIILWFVYDNDLINQITRKRHYQLCFTLYSFFVIFSFLYYAISCMCIFYVRQRFFSFKIIVERKNWMEFPNQTYFKKEI